MYMNEKLHLMNLKPNKNRHISAIIKAAALLLVLCTATNIYAQNNKAAGANIGLVYPVSSNWRSAPADTNNFSLNAIAGVSAAEHGISIAGLSNIVRQDASGVQIAGLSNNIGGNANGVMVAGLMNSYAHGKGVTIAGFTNIAKTSSNVQVAGFLNVGKNVSALQLGGFMNLAKNMKGIQVAGFMNAAKNMKGVQVAGFLNLAKTSKGTQIGFINIADTAGTQIGLINLTKNNEMSFGVTIDENQTTLLDFNSGGKVLYGIMGIGYNFKNKKDKYAYEAGFGAHVVNTRSFLINTEIVNGGLLSFKGGEDYKTSFRLMPAIKVGPIEIFGGPSFNYINTDTEDGKSMVKNYFNHWTRGRDLYGFYFGYTAGIKALF